MVREYWKQTILNCFSEKSVLWLTGVRRAGKTTLCKDIVGEDFYDCELPRIRKLFVDSEEFFKNCKAKIIAIDEIHRLENPSEVLKIAADYFPNIKVIATGSSTLSATKKFKDSLTDRKRSVFLTPMNSYDLVAFKSENIEQRILKGGLPPFFLSKKLPESGYQDWLDSFWAKDIEELFKIENKSAFLKFFEMLAMQSGGMFEAKSFSAPCGVSHTTIANYLMVMEKTHIAYRLRPFHKRSSKEIVAAPKVYFFDTGFICYFQGWNELHNQELGFLWEHIVLNEMLGFLPKELIHYWRSKSQQEIDFVVKKRGQKPIAIECKWKESEFDPKSLISFRKLHPEGENFVVTQSNARDIKKRFHELDVQFVSLKSLIKKLNG